MRAILGFVVFGMVLLVVPLLRGEYVTIHIDPVEGEQATNLVSVSSNQSIQVISGHVIGVNNALAVDYILENAEFTFGLHNYHYMYGREATLAGPAVIRLRGSKPGYLTVKIMPERFDPQKTLLVPPASGGRVAMERSTNLVDWVEATNGVYDGALEASFLRARLDGVTPYMQPSAATPDLRSASQIITLYCPGGPDAVTIGPHQSLEIVTMAELGGSISLSAAGSVKVLNTQGYNNREHWSPIRGPATLRLGCGTQDFLTVRISAEAYPPDKTMILLPGTNSYNVTLEGSTNLVDWSTATNGVYTEPSAMFFRINSQRVN